MLRGYIGSDLAGKHPNIRHIERPFTGERLAAAPAHRPDAGIIHAQRGMTLAPEFTRTLHTAIRAQARMPFNPDECADAVGDLLIAHPSTFARLPLAQARTIGNE